MIEIVLGPSDIRGSVGIDIQGDHITAFIVGAEHEICVLDKGEWYQGTLSEVIRWWIDSH